MKRQMQYRALTKYVGYLTDSFNILKKCNGSAIRDGFEFNPNSTYFIYLYKYFKEVFNQGIFIRNNNEPFEMKTIFV